MLHSNDRMSKLETWDEKWDKSRRAVLRKFCRDEEGGIIIMTIVLLIAMLVIAGMAVDFMRFESRRALLQSVSDRAVLSAASLDQTLDGKQVIVDYFDKAGFPEAIVGTPVVDKEPGTGNSEVSVNSQIDVKTFYLHLVGIDTLSAPASSRAVQGVGNVEISLVLDISGSMRHKVWVDEAVVDGNGEPVIDENGDVVTTRVRRTKIELLQKAASDFVEDMLVAEYRNQISINLIPYSQQVALSDDLYKALRTTPDSISESGLIGSSFGSITDGYATLPDDPDAPIDISWANNELVNVNPSRCIDFEEADFVDVEFDLSKRYNQVERFDHYSGSGTSTVTRPVCPDQEFETILLASQDVNELKRRIGLFRPTTFTSIHLGVKWGISLLDPDLRPVLAGIDSIDDAFRGSRPSEYSGDTVKYLIVMTDGQNQADQRVAADAYDSYEERERWKDYPLDYWVAENLPTNDEPENYTRLWGSNTQFNTWMETLCDAAKPKMSIYTIAMGAGDGADQIAKCASQPSYAFATNFNSAAGEPGIDEIFQTIAQRIKALRLNL
ncbi:pilus assembly protein [Yoonia sp. F2084L]|nr:pilus assembly protein [Yoonia sp. F2084L]